MGRREWVCRIFQTEGTAYTKAVSQEEQVMLMELTENQCDDPNCSEGELENSVSQGQMHLNQWWSSNSQSLLGGVKKLNEIILVKHRVQCLAQNKAACKCSLLLLPPSWGIAMSPSLTMYTTSINYFPLFRHYISSGHVRPLFSLNSFLQSHSPHWVPPSHMKAFRNSISA